MYVSVGDTSFVSRFVYSNYLAIVRGVPICQLDTPQMIMESHTDKTDFLDDTDG